MEISTRQTTTTTYSGYIHVHRTYSRTIEREVAALFSSLLGNFPERAVSRAKIYEPDERKRSLYFHEPSIPRFLDSACLTIEDFLPSLSISLSLSLTRSESLHNATTMIKYSLACKSKSQRSRVHVYVRSCATRTRTQRSSLPSMSGLERGRVNDWEGRVRGGVPVIKMQNSSAFNCMEYRNIRGVKWISGYSPSLPPPSRSL